MSRLVDRRLPSLTPLALALVLAPACSSSSFVSEGSGGGTAAGAGGASNGAGGAAAGAGGAGTGGGSVACPEAATMLDVASAPGAGEGYPAPTLSATCTDATFVVDANGIPPYTFVQTTPNPLAAQALHYEIPRSPALAAEAAEIPLLGTIGFAVNGLPIFGPNEGAQPAESAYGDPVYNGLMDPCLGHTAFVYHYHSMEEKCLVASGLVAEPWMDPDPAADAPSPVLGWALDGFPIYGPRECADSGCSSIVTLKSGYDQVGDPTKNAWDAYSWSDHGGEAGYLDACNGHHGLDGAYHYHATATFPYILGCYRGAPASQGMQGGGGGMQGGGGGMQGGPQACETSDDCAGACPPGSMGCACADSPMGMICVPTCGADDDCPSGPMGLALHCKDGVCVP